MIENPNVFLIIIDALRDDYSKPIISHLEKMGFVVYKNTISTAPWTGPSHASMVTGLYPSFHGAHETKTKKTIDIKLSKHKNIYSFVPLLNNMGYKCYLLTGNIFVSPYFGYRGFTKYIDTSLPIFLNDDELTLLSNIKAEKASKKISVVKSILKRGDYWLLLKMLGGYGLRKLKWPKDKGVSATIYHLKNILKATASKYPLFFMMNLPEVHEPYSRWEDVSSLRENNRMGYIPPEKVIRRWRKKYPMQVNYLKQKLFEMLKILQDFDIFEKSLIIITSDHGQMLGEYGIIGHGTYLYDELLKVPLAIKYPQNRKILLNEQKDFDYISLLKIKSLVVNTINAQTIDDSILYSPVVFAESYGIPEQVNPRTEEEKEHVRQLEKYRIAVYSEGSKAIFNVTDWNFEELPARDSLTFKKNIIKFLDMKVSQKDFSLRMSKK